MKLAVTAAVLTMLILALAHSDLVLDRFFSHEAMAEAGQETLSYRPLAL
jgi:hypothetical protein